MTSHNPISVFTPSRSNPEDLEAIMVQRHDILVDAVERIEESASTDNKHHLLFVGPRGTGKTHLMTLLVHRLSTTPNLCIAWLNEDETSTTLIEFLLRIYTALQKRYPLDFSANDIDPIYDLSPADAERELIKVLLEKLQSKSLLVVVENLDALFEGLGKEGQQKLRAFIQEHPVLSIVATAQRLVEGISKRSNAFFGFFQIENLKPLTVEEAAELLSNIARHREEKELADFIQTPVGLSRIRALHHLSGGNHRIYIVLSQFITSKTIDLLVEPFAKMIDEMTPYYQERIRWLPPQQRKIVEFLCNVDRPATVKQIARRLFTSNQTISSQLKDLRGKGYVQAGQRGRESLYEITEPLMRICVEVKENQNSEPLKILVDFLRVWYDKLELYNLLDNCDPMNSEYEYLLSAINKNEEQGSLRIKLLIDGFRNNLEFGDAENLAHLNIIEQMACMHDELGLAYGIWVSGEENKSMTVYQSLIDKKTIPSNIKAVAFLALHLMFKNNKEHELSLKYLNTALDLPGLDVEISIPLLIARVDCYRQLKLEKEAVRDLTTLIDSGVGSGVDVGRFILQRSELFFILGDQESQLNDLESLINSSKTSGDILTKSLFQRAKLHVDKGRLESAHLDLEKVIDHASSHVSLNLAACVNYFLVNVEREDGKYRESAFSLLDMGLTKTLGLNFKHSYYVKPLLTAIFGSFSVLGTTGTNILRVVDIYAKNNLLLVLAEGVISHLGQLLMDGDVVPRSDGVGVLDCWAIEWEVALSGYPETSVLLRIFHTGIEFLKSGGEDRSVLLSLHQEERRILEQVFQLES